MSFERTGDPIKDAERYYAEQEDRPIKEFWAYITTVTTIKCYGRDEEEAKQDADEKADNIRDLIFFSDSEDIADCDNEKIIVQESDI